MPYLNILKPLSVLFIGILLCIQASLAYSGDQPHHLHFVSFIEPPYIFDPEESDDKGLVEILLDKLMKKIDIQYDISILPAKRAEIIAKTTENTCVLPIEKSQEREVFFSWISPILISKHGFFGVPSSSFITLNTLNDAYPYRIGSYLGSGIGEYLNSFKYKVDFATQNEANVQKLKAKRIDLWASDILSAQHISKHAGIKISPSKLDFFTSLRAIGCHLDVDRGIIKKMRKQLQTMYKDGTMFTTIQKFKADNFDTSTPSAHRNTAP